MKNFLQLPQFNPGSQQIDFSAPMNALEGLRDQRNYQGQVARQKEAQTYQRGRDTKQDARQETFDNMKIAESLAKRADAIGRLPQEQRGPAWQRHLAEHERYFPGNQLDPEDLDPMQGPARYAAAFGGIARDPREDKLTDLKLQGANLDNQYRQAQITDLQNKRSTDAKREQQLAQMGIDPNSAEGIAFMANGKLPAATIERRIQDERKTATSPNIAAGLQNLNKMADTYDDTAFESAVGPIQGATPDGLLSSIPINVARLYGELTNARGGGNANPSEVRNNITGATETLAAAIKPLIRAPGEGVWTDQDQARLVAIVGDLAQARDKGEFRRRLNAVRDRVKANFNLDIPFEAMGLDGSALQGRANAPLVGGGNDAKAALKQKYGVDLE